MKLPKKLLASKVNSVRPYKSRSKRPCDFCRRRKTCCIIEKLIPCLACIQFDRGECTFLEGPIKRTNRSISERKKANASARNPKSVQSSEVVEFVDQSQGTHTQQHQAEYPNSSIPRYLKDSHFLAPPYRSQFDNKKAGHAPSGLETPYITDYLQRLSVGSDPVLEENKLILLAESVAALIEQPYDVTQPIRPSLSESTALYDETSSLMLVNGIPQSQSSGYQSGGVNNLPLGPVWMPDSGYFQQPLTTLRSVSSVPVREENNQSGQKKPDLANARSYWHEAYSYTSYAQQELGYPEWRPISTALDTNYGSQSLGEDFWLTHETVETNWRN